MTERLGSPGGVAARDFLSSATNPGVDPVRAICEDAIPRARRPSGEFVNSRNKRG
jgi:hypothetical protein